MVLAIGTDIAEVPRIEATIARFGARFLERTFTPAEIAYCSRRRAAAQSFAARFAAKEAGAKALGTGIGHGITWLEIEVQREPSGQPLLVYHGYTLTRALALGVRRTSLSLTHTAALALAVVVLEGEPAGR